MVGLTIAWVLPNIVVAITCWQQSHGDSLRGVHSPSVSFGLFFINFRLSLIVFAPMICLNDVFLRNATTVVVLNTSPNVSLMFNICQCFLISSLIFRSLDFMIPKMKLCFPYCFRVIWQRWLSFFRFGLGWYLYLNLFGKILLLSYFHALNKHVLLLIFHF